MSLTRVHNPLSLALVRRLGDAGGPRADQVAAELDSLIAWAKDAPRCIRRNTAIVGNVGTGSDTLDSFSLDTPNRLTTNGDWLRLHYAGHFTASGNTRSLNATFGGQFLTAMGKVFVVGADVGWTLDTMIVRVSDTTARVSSRTIMNDLYVNAAATPTTFGNAGFFEAYNTTVTVSDMDSNALSIVLLGEGNSNDDIIKNMAIIELCQQ